MTKQEYVEYLKQNGASGALEKLVEYYQDQIPDDAQVIAGDESFGLSLSEDKKDYFLTSVNKRGELDVLNFKEHRKTQLHSDWLSFSYQVSDEMLLARCNITVDDKQIEVPNNAEEQPFALKQKAAFMQHTYTGYMSLNNGVLMKRKIIAIGTRLILISDDFYAIGLHDYIQLWRFQENTQVQPSANVIRCTGQKVQLDLYCLSGSTTHEHTIYKMLDDKPERHQQLEKQYTVLAKKTGASFCSMLTLLHAYERTSKRKFADSFEIRKLIPESVFIGTAMTDSSAEAIEIQTKDKRYIIFVGHQDVFGVNDMIRVGDCSGFGNIIVFEASKEEKPSIVLN